MSAALDARGLKRVCVGCGIRFYDLNKRPIKCPNCSTEFSGEIKLKGRRGRAAIADIQEEVVKPKAPIANDDQNELEEVAEEGVVSLDEVEALENADDDEDEDAITIDDEDLALEDLEEIEDEVLEDEVEKDK